MALHPYWSSTAAMYSIVKTALYSYVVPYVCQLKIGPHWNQEHCCYIHYIKCICQASRQEPYKHTRSCTLPLSTPHPSRYSVFRWKMRQKCELHRRATLVPSEAANWCEWINHLQLAIPNAYVWANGRAPPARGGKLMCWWAMSQIFTGPNPGPQAVPLPACQPSRHRLCFFPSISVSLCLSLPLSLSLHLASPFAR